MIRGILSGSVIPTRMGTRNWGWFHRALKKKEIVDQIKDEKFEIALGRKDSLKKEVKRKKAFFDISIDEKNTGRIVFQLAVCF